MNHFLLGVTLDSSVRRIVPVVEDVPRGAVIHLEGNADTEDDRPLGGSWEVAGAFIEASIAPIEAPDGLQKGWIGVGVYRR